MIKPARDKKGRIVGKPKEIRKCRVCKNTFLEYPSQNKSFCSKECRTKWKSENSKGNKNPNWNKNIKNRKCPICEKKFRPKYKNNVCCSFDCFKKLFIGRKPSHSKGGKREDLGNLYFRSVWEANIARLFSYIGVKWIFEPKTFVFKEVTRGSKSYLPDFYLPELNLYIEVKGWMKSSDRTKLKRMEKYYPDIDLYLLDKDQYLELEEKYSHHIPSWEYSNASQSQQNKKNTELKKKVIKMLLDKGFIADI